MHGISFVWALFCVGSYKSDTIHETPCLICMLKTTLTGLVSEAQRSLYAFFFDGYCSTVQGLLDWF